MERTINNLAKAFIGESQARNRYTFYSAIAKNEGLEQLSEIFLVTAENEREHAKWLMRMINDLRKKARKGVIKVDAEVPETLSTTLDNLKAAIAGEHYEYSKMYPEFAAAAEKEGLAEVAARLRSIAKAEKHHEDRYRSILRELTGGTAFRKPKSTMWVCRKCGYVHEGKEPPEKCPSCSHPKSYFELLCEKY